jgi:hypothetical protein
LIPGATISGKLNASSKFDELGNHRNRFDLEQEGVEHGSVKDTLRAEEAPGKGRGGIPERLRGQQ